MVNNALRVLRNFLRSVWSQWRRFFKAAVWTIRRALRLAFASLRRLLFGKRRSERHPKAAKNQPEEAEAAEEAAEEAVETAAQPE